MPSTGKRNEKILLIRNDRIGDLVLTTPAITVLAGALPGARIDLLCSSYARPVVQGNPHLNAVLTDLGAHESSDLAELSHQVSRRAYDCAVVMVSSWKNARLVGKAGIPIRIGPLVKLYAPFFFNRAVRQQRSLGARHEADYNVDLLSPLGVTIPRELPPPLVTARKETVARAGSMLDETFGKQRGRPLVIVHPGMGGSALNWPEALWARLTGLLGREKGVSVLVTGSQRELGMLERVALAAACESEGRMKIKCGLPLEDYIALLSLSSVVAAPSTGPLHLASALGKPVVGIYSPVPAHHPKRWGPLGRGAKKVFLPHVDCPGALHCLEKGCPHFPCMESINPEKVLEQILVFSGIF